MPSLNHKTVIPAGLIAERLSSLGGEITNHYLARPEPLTVVALLKGSLYFAADLTRAIALPLRLEFLTVSSYHDGTESSGTIDCPQAMPDLTGRQVLLLDDVLDTGLTLAAIRRRIERESGAAEVRTAVLLRKKKEQAAEADWVGFSIGPEFVVGYGLDHAQEYRNLPDICVLTPSR